MAFPATALDIRVQIALDSPDLSNPLLWSWTTVTTYVKISDGITIKIGRADAYQQMPPATMSMTVINSDGRWTRTNPLGAWYGRIGRNTPIRVQVNNGSGYKTRFTGTIDAFPPRWNYTGRYAVAQITASGALRRMEKHGSTRSALFRASTNGYYGSGEAIGYWPCEDAEGATSIASGIGGAPASFSGDLDLAADSDMAGSDPLPKLTATSGIVATIPDTTATSWAARWAMRIPAEPAGDTVLMAWNCSTPSPFTHFRLLLTPGSPAVVKLQALNAVGAEQLADGGIPFVDSSGTGTEPWGVQIYFEVNVAQNGTGIDWSHTFYVAPHGYGSSGTEPSATVVPIVQMYTVPQAGTANVTVGHMAFATDVLFGPGADGQDGYAGEDTGSRWVRIGNEMSLPWDWTAAASTAMGAQTTSTLIDQIREIGTAEGVPIYDDLDGFLFAPDRQSRYNQTVALSLSFTASQLQPPQPTDDDRYIINDVTVTRPGGSSHRTTKTTGTNSTAVGVYESGQTINIERDRDLPFRSQWLVHHGTVDELRYPVVDVNWASRGITSAKIDNWLNCVPGSRIQLTSPGLPGLAPDTVDLLLEGWTEYLRSPREWGVSLTCSPYAPWTVFQLEDDTLGRLDTSGSELLSTVTSSATTMLLATTGDPIPPKTSAVVWSTTSEPYDLHVGGERVTVTNMVTNAATFVGAGTAAHGDNASVVPGLPAGIQTGDLLLLLTAIRNTSAFAGAVTNPSGWEVLYNGSNVLLLGRIHDGSGAPTCAFSGGSAGDTTSAQIAAFRNCQLVAHASSSTSNAAAANITTPALTMARDRCVVVTVGWKQDDWTSVATLGGMTEIGEPSTPTGNNQGIVWDYVIQTTAANIAASSFVVTGGTNQVGKAAVVALLGDVQTATVTRAVNGVSKAQTAGTDVALWRPGVGGLAL